MFQLSRVVIDLMICLACLAVRYGIGCRQKEVSSAKRSASNGRNKNLRRKSRQNRYVEGNHLGTIIGKLRNLFESAHKCKCKLSI